MHLIAAVLLAVFASQDPKVAITTTGAESGSRVDSRFGRTQWVLIHDPVKDEWQSIDNATLAAQRGSAGVGTATLLVKRGVKAVITGECGPKALGTLTAAGVKVYNGAGRTAKEALADYRAGRLREIR